MTDSIFTKIIKGEIPSYKIYEDEKTFAFLDIHPIQPGHVLLVPKKQIDKLEDLDDELYAYLWKTTKVLMRHLGNNFPDRRITLKVEGFDVPHVHIHLIPCRNANDFWNRVSASDPIDHAALAQMAQKLAF